MHTTIEFDDVRVTESRSVDPVRRSATVDLTAIVRINHPSSSSSEEAPEYEVTATHYLDFRDGEWTGFDWDNESSIKIERRFDMWDKVSWNTVEHNRVMAAMVFLEIDPSILSGLTDELIEAAKSHIEQANSQISTAQSLLDDLAK